MKLTVKQLTKSYPGKEYALDHVSFELTPGIYGLLGPNGAGKTTIMNVLTGNIRADSGEIRWNGQLISELGKQYLSLIGYVPQQQWMYEDFTVRDYLHYFSALKGIPKKLQRERIDELLRQTNLQIMAQKKICTLSGGMKQRVLLAQALLNEPKILILDEPTAGLDPQERIRIRGLISEIAKECIVILATHVVSDIECISKEIMMLQDGNLIRKASPKELIKELDGVVYTSKLKGNIPKWWEEECIISNVNVTATGFEVRMVGESPVPLRYRHYVVPTLEDVYLYLTARGIQCGIDI